MGTWSPWRKLASVTDAFRSGAGTTQWRWRQLSINEDKVVKLERGEWSDTRKKKEGICSFHPQGKPPYVEGLKTKRTNQHTKLTNAEGAFFFTTMETLSPFLQDPRADWGGGSRLHKEQTSVSRGMSQTSISRGMSQTRASQNVWVMKILASSGCSKCPVP